MSRINKNMLITYLVNIGYMVHDDLSCPQSLLTLVQSLFFFLCSHTPTFRVPLLFMVASLFLRDIISVFLNCYLRTFFFFSTSKLAKFTNTILKCSGVLYLLGHSHCWTLVRESVSRFFPFSTREHLSM